jgi:hypothetical protein
VLRSRAAYASVQQAQQQQQQQRLHVGIAKVALMAKENGFRSSMRDTQSAMMLASQVCCACQFCTGLGWKMHHKCWVACSYLSSGDMGMFVCLNDKCGC